MRVFARGKGFAVALTVAAVAGAGAAVLPIGGPGWSPVSYAYAADRRALTADPATILPAGISPERPARVVGTAVDSGGRPVITVREAGDPVTAARLVEQAQQATNALGVEIDGAVHALEVPSGSDPYRDRQWDLTTMNVPAAWPRSTGDGVTVAVIDTGVDGRHPDLTGHVLTGYDAITNTAGGNTDPQGHGTHVAGTIGALTGNGIGVAGIAPDVTILPVRVLDAKGSGFDSDTAEGIVWAADHGADVINMSLGGTMPSTAVTNAVAYARGKGVVVVAAAGNDRAKGSPTSYPGADPGVIAVAATDSGDVVASYSNAGSYVDVAAPGSGIISTYPTAAGGYATMNGTSMASPHVAAVAALLLAAAPDLTPDQVESALGSTAKDLGPTGKDTDYGYGRIDAAAALTSVTGSVPVTAPVVTTVAVTSSVSSRSVAYGTRTSTTFTATPWAGRPASLCISVAGGSWSCSTVTTGATGTYPLTRAATASFRARLSVAATTTNTAASATTTYTVKAVVSVRRTAKKTLVVAVTGATGQRLVVQRYANRRWSTVKSYRATSSRKVTGLVSGGSYRVVLSSNAKVLGVTSKTVKA
ncbi:S8 family peptidase [Actinoplanes sp. NPDC020271]|uniref:S8 family peptidase n=1 Tax=Actinoplanes sp. NPDC020271 TaxID=3363896 RepID=UPI00379D5099